MADDPTKNKYLKLLKGSSVIGVGGLSTGTVDLTGLASNQHVTQGTYKLSYDKDNTTTLSSDALVPIDVPAFYTLGVPQATTISLKPMESAVTFTIAKATSYTKPVTGYIVYYKQHTATTWTDVNQAVDALTGQVTGLDSTASYDFKVVAVNAIGNSPDSPTVTTTPVSTPPVNLKSVATEDGATISAMYSTASTNNLVQGTIDFNRWALWGNPTLERTQASNGTWHVRITKTDAEAQQGIITAAPITFKKGDKLTLSFTATSTLSDGTLYVTNVAGGGNKYVTAIDWVAGEQSYSYTWTPDYDSGATTAIMISDSGASPVGTYLEIVGKTFMVSTNSSITSWQPSPTDGAIDPPSNYELRIVKASNTNTVVASGEPNATITGLASDVKVETAFYKACWYNTSSKTSSSFSEVPGFTPLLHQPKAPTLALSVTDSSITYKLSLNADDGAPGNGKQDIKYCTIYYQETGSNKPLSFRTNDPANTLVTSGVIANLKQDASYDVFATVTNARKTSDFSSTFTAKTKFGKPSTPILTFVSSTQEAATFDVELDNDGAPNDTQDATFYFSYKFADGGNWSTWVKGGTSNSITLSGLLVGIQYIVKCKAINPDAESAESNAVTFATHSPQIKASEQALWVVKNGNLIADTAFMNDHYASTWKHGVKVDGAWTDASGTKHNAWNFTATKDWDGAHSISKYSRFRANILPGDVVTWRYHAKIISGGNASLQTFAGWIESFDGPTSGRVEWAPWGSEPVQMKNQKDWTVVTGSYTFKSAHPYIALAMGNTGNSSKLNCWFSAVELYVNGEPPTANVMGDSGGYDASSLKDIDAFEAPAQSRFSLNMFHTATITQTGTGGVTVTPDPLMTGRYIVQGTKDGEVDLAIADSYYPDNKTNVHVYINTNESQVLPTTTTTTTTVKPTTTSTTTSTVKPTTTTSTTTTTKPVDPTKVPLISISVNGSTATFNLSFKLQAGNVASYNVSVFGENTGYKKNLNVPANDDATAQAVLTGLSKDIYDVYFSSLSKTGTNVVDGISNIFRVS